MIEKEESQIFKKINRKERYLQAQKREKKEVTGSKKIDTQERELPAQKNK